MLAMVLRFLFWTIYKILVTIDRHMKSYRETGNPTENEDEDHGMNGFPRQGILHEINGYLEKSISKKNNCSIYSPPINQNIELDFPKQDFPLQSQRF